MRTILITIAALVLLAPSALARPAARVVPASVAPRPAAPVKAPAATTQAPATPKVQRLSFDDDLVSADRDLGDGDVLSEPAKMKFPSLVRPRDSFVPELIKSAEDI